MTVIDPCPPLLPVWPTLGDVAAELQSVLCERGGDVLRVGVAHEELDAREAAHDHVVDRVAPRAPHPDHRDLGRELVARVAQVLQRFVIEQEGEGVKKRIGNMKWVKF